MLGVWVLRALISAKGRARVAKWDVLRGVVLALSIEDRGASGDLPYQSR